MFQTIKLKKCFLLLSAVFLLFSCEKSSYKISGEFKQGNTDSVMVFLKERINSEWKTIDSTLVVQNKFEFTGKADSARVVFMMYKNSDGEKFRQPFVLENGDITASIDSLGDITFSGTPQNELLQTYQSEKKMLYAEMDAYYNATNKPGLSDAETTRMNDSLEKFTKREIAIDSYYAKKHVNTIVGNYIFTSSCYQMSIPQKEEIIALMNQDYLQTEKIAGIVEAIDKEKQTAKGMQFTDIVMNDLQNREVKLSEIVGKHDYVLVDFWASWCGPCMQAVNKLKVLYSKYGGEKFEIVGVSLDDNKESWQNAIHEKGMNWIQMSDLKGWRCKGADDYAVDAIPATVLIDKSGKIVGRDLYMEEIENIISGTHSKK